MKKLIKEDANSTFFNIRYNIAEPISVICNTNHYAYVDNSKNIIVVDNRKYSTKFIVTGHSSLESELEELGVWGEKTIGKVIFSYHQKDLLRFRIFKASDFSVLDCDIVAFYTSEENVKKNSNIINQVIKKVCETPKIYIDWGFFSKEDLQNNMKKYPKNYFEQRKKIDPQLSQRTASRKWMDSIYQKSGVWENYLNFKIKLEETSLMPGSSEMPTNMPSRTQSQKEQLRPNQNDYAYGDDSIECEYCKDGWQEDGSMCMHCQGYGIRKESLNWDDWDIDFGHDLNTMSKKGNFKVGQRVSYEGKLGKIIKYNLLGAYTVKFDDGSIIRKIHQSELEPGEENLLGVSEGFIGSEENKDINTINNTTGQKTQTGTGPEAINSLEDSLENTRLSTNILKKVSTGQSTNAKSDANKLLNTNTNNLIGKKVGDIDQDLLSSLLATDTIEIDSSGIVRKKV